MGWLQKLVSLYFVGIVLSVAVFYLSALPDSPDAAKFSQLTIAHRGDALNFPENSLSAISGAHQLKADAVEIDVMMTSDGVLVAMHDPSLERTTNGTGLVADHSYSDISTLTLKAGNSNTDERIPTLEEVVLLTRSLGLKLELELKNEIKSKYQAILEVARIFEKHQMYEYAFVSLFDPRFLYYLRSENPKIVTALAIKQHPPYNKLVEFLIRRDGFLDYPGVGVIEPSTALADEDLIQKWVAKKKVVSVWMVNSQREKDWFKGYPVSIITDCPSGFC